MYMQPCQGAYVRGQHKSTAAALPNRDSCGVVLKVSDNRQKYMSKANLKIRRQNFYEDTDLHYLV